MCTASTLLWVVAVSLWSPLAGEDSDRPEQQAIVGRTVGLGDDVTLELVWIPPGSFVMGSPEHESGRNYDEGPTREIDIQDGFWMGRYPVTQEQWEQVMGDNPSNFQRSCNLPVENVSIDNCEAFLVTLNDLYSQQYAGGKFRLPTECEWEYACRAGTDTRFYFGDDIGYKELQDYAWYKDNSGNETHPVGKKKPNRLGLYDMHGNVWELCDSVYTPRYYSGDTGESPEPLIEGIARYPVARGGSWYSAAASCRAAYRYTATAALGQYGVRGLSSTIGFRVIFEPKDGS